MANVKGVILNGAKYESQDTEARALAGQAINQVETLKNTVTDLETGFTNLGETVANVNQTATTAKTTADEANSLAQQAETRAQSAYELADAAGHQNGILPDTVRIEPRETITLTEKQVDSLFPFLAKGTAEGKTFFVNILGTDIAGNPITGWAFFIVSSGTIQFRDMYFPTIAITHDGDSWKMINEGSNDAHVLAYSFIQS